MIDQLEILDSIESTTYDLTSTRTSKRADKIQSRLTKKLSGYLDLFKLEIGKKSYYTIKQQYQTEIHDLLRYGIEDAYFEGLEYSDHALGQRQPITVKDIQRIDTMTQQAENRFWGLVAKTEPIKEFSFNFLISTIFALASDIVTKSLNTATLANMEPINPVDYQSNLQVMFVTRQDEKVCQICEPYNNNVYDINDSSKPEIPDDTHPNCRCRYAVYQNGKAIIEAKK